MKITHIIAAGFMAAGIGMSGAASAQMNNGSLPPRGAQRMDHRGGDIRDDRGRHDDRRDMRDRRDDRRSYGRDDRRGWGHGRQRCRTEWRHHHRVRICR
ncbi:hypothetical protein EWE75_23750 [Sphingomonas populi]|uniref:Uncharacterized protein n=1 Tax=Sphingomonas populi TaxID=2484750 RepID=A0A4Q6XNY0_9SPHN|nr:hypothetical protein EWE75_23750 [Sphingomonas populi]